MGFVARSREINQKFFTNLLSEIFKRKKPFVKFGLKENYDITSNRVHKNTDITTYRRRQQVGR